ncbi:large ribosomal subunit protein uL23m-like [Watersipora subatra]|uniref:large ribosomal subunit protein uL23m-like n=1 Tax=Watersipora subatra TaxID=2589382 RepID=UPI00355C2188
MAYTRYGHAGQIIPFWKRQITPLPKWQKGDPQIRICLPTFWMKMVKPPPDAPSNQVYFVTHQQMTRVDIKNYLEKIYGVSVDSVRTEIKLTPNQMPGMSPAEATYQQNKVNPHPVRDKMRQDVKWSEEYKQAIVTLGEGQTFEFPDIEGKLMEDEALVHEQNTKLNTDKPKPTGGLPEWFK